jgi:hypothetical protein
MTSKVTINLADLLRQRTVEGERIEYKAGWNPESVLHPLCAFAPQVGIKLGLSRDQVTGEAYLDQITVLQRQFPQ